MPPSIEDVVPGAWEVTVSIGPEQLQTMIVFTRDGSLIETAAVRLEPSLGFWEVTGVSTFRFTMRAWVHQNPATPGIVVHTVQAPHNTLDPSVDINQFSGPSTLHITDLATGSPIGSPVTTMQSATRMS